MRVDVRVFAARRANGAVVIDVRQPEEYLAGHIPGAVMVPLGEIEGRIPELPRGREVFVVCKSGNRSLLATDILNRAGRTASSLHGGTDAWAAAGYPVVSGPHRS